MNIMIYWKNTQGEEELITPALDGTVLPGITRVRNVIICFHIIFPRIQF
jgi:branched-subunit amino acid aminotransferase/4-amino-4-deoxychorismate lyase